MKRSSTSILLFFAILAVIFFNSCASSTLITSEPPGAELYVNGKHVGKTPYTYSDTRIIGNKVDITLEKEGYIPLRTFFTRTEDVDVGAIVGGIFVWPAFLWAMKYYPEHFYELWPIVPDEAPEDQLLPPPPPLKVAIPDSKVERLRELKKLLDEKILTESEFQNMKEKLINEDNK
jgi:hypothetical protein